MTWSRKLNLHRHRADVNLQRTVTLALDLSLLLHSIWLLGAKFTKVIDRASI